MNRKKSSKWIAWVVIILFIGMSAIPSIAVNETKRNEKVDRNTIYVDINNIEGPWDGTIEHPYQYIQEGIDDADYGDTVYVFSGTYKNQYVYIGTTINLVGEDKETTVLYTYAVWWMIEIHADNVNVSGFTFRNMGCAEGNQKMLIEADYCTISDNIFADDYPLICIRTLTMNDSHHNIITRNVFGVLTSQLYCIKLKNSTCNTISENVFSMKMCNIDMANSNENIIIDNTFTHSWICMFLNLSSSNIISGNLFNGFRFGLNFGDSSNNNKITYNRFENITRRFLEGKLYFGRPVYFSKSKNTFDHNYWNRGRIFPKIIFGCKTVNGRVLPDFSVFEIDWHPMKS